MSLLLSNFDLAAIIATIISITASIYMFKNTPKYDLVYKRYNELISPLFNIIEPNLFMPVSKEILAPIFKIIKDNKSLAGGRLIELSYYCENNPSQNNFDNLCIYISSEYDSCCSRLGLKRRSIWYKIIRKQYKTNLVFILYTIWNTFIFLAVLLSFLIVIAVFLMYIEKITNLDIFPLAR